MRKLILALVLALASSLSAQVTLGGSTSGALGVVYIAGAPLSYAGRTDGCVSAALTPTISGSAANFSQSYVSGTNTLTIGFTYSTTNTSATNYLPGGNPNPGQVFYITATNGSTTSYYSAAAGELATLATPNYGCKGASCSGGQLVINPGKTWNNSTMTVNSLGFCRAGTTWTTLSGQSAAVAGTAGSELTYFGTPCVTGDSGCTPYLALNSECTASGAPFGCCTGSGTGSCTGTYIGAIGSPDTQYFGNLFDPTNPALMNTCFTDPDFGYTACWATDHVSGVSSATKTYCTTTNHPAPPGGETCNPYFSKSPLAINDYLVGTPSDTVAVLENSGGIQYFEHVIESRVLAGSCSPTTNVCFIPSNVYELAGGCNPYGGCPLPCSASNAGPPGGCPSGQFLPSGCAASAGTSNQCSIQTSGPTEITHAPGESNTFYEMYYGTGYPGAWQPWKCVFVSSLASGLPTGAGDYITCSLYADFQNGGMPGIGWDYNILWGTGSLHGSVTDSFSMPAGGGQSYEAIGNGNGAQQTLTINTFVMPVHNDVNSAACANAQYPTREDTNDCYWVFQYIPPGCNIGDGDNCLNIGHTTAPTGGDGGTCPSGTTLVSDVRTVMGRANWHDMCEPTWGTFSKTQYIFDVGSNSPVAFSGSGWTSTRPNGVFQDNVSCGSPTTLPNGCSYVYTVTLNSAMSGLTTGSYVVLSTTGGSSSWNNSLVEACGPPACTAPTTTVFSFLSASKSDSPTCSSGCSATLWAGNTNLQGGVKIAEPAGGFWINLGKNASQGPGFDIVNYDSTYGYSHWNTRTQFFDRGCAFGSLFVNGSCTAGTNSLPCATPSGAPSGFPADVCKTYTTDPITCIERTGTTTPPFCPSGGVTTQTFYTLHDANNPPANGFVKSSPTGGGAVNCNYLGALTVDPNDCSPQSGLTWPEAANFANGESFGQVNATQSFWPAYNGLTSWTWPQAMPWQCGSGGGCDGGITSSPSTPGTPYTAAGKYAIDPFNFQIYVTTRAVTNGTGACSSGANPANCSPSELTAAGNYTWQILPYYPWDEIIDWLGSLTSGNPISRTYHQLGPVFAVAGPHAFTGQLGTYDGGNLSEHQLNQPSCITASSACAPLWGQSVGYTGQVNPGGFLLYTSLPSDSHERAYANGNPTDTAPFPNGSSTQPYWAFDPKCGTTGHPICPGGLTPTQLANICPGPGYTGTDMLCNSYVSALYGEDYAFNANPKNGLIWRLFHAGGFGSSPIFDTNEDFIAINADGRLYGVTSDADGSRGDTTTPSIACTSPLHGMSGTFPSGCTALNDIFLTKNASGYEWQLTSCGSGQACGTSNYGCTVAGSGPNTTSPTNYTDANGNTWTVLGANSCEGDVFVGGLPQ